MSISFNHPDNIVTSTSALKLSVAGGSTTSPQPIRLDSTSVIMPVRALPTGEAGAQVFDSTSKTMKYHDGTSWVELLGRDVILEPIYLQISNIQTQLNNKVGTVTYSTSAIPTASISGTNLNIVFPTPSTSSNTNGLFTTSPPGSIMHYSLTSGQSIASIREQMSGVSGGQSGRNGTQGNPYVSKTGWCLSDGLWWQWVGSTGTVTKQVPALNNTPSYLKSLGADGITRTDSVIGASTSTGSTQLSIAQLPVHSLTFSGQTDPNGQHVHTFPLTDDRSGTGRADGGSTNRQDGIQQTDAGGLHVHTFSGTTNPIGSGQGHSHSLDSLDVTHFNVAVLYNIAEPSVALNQDAGDLRYVLKSGDTMTGSLSIANSVTVRSDDTSLPFYFRNSSGGERAAIFHNNTTGTLRLRSAGGSEVSINSSGLLNAPALQVSTTSATVNGQNIVRSVNGVVADSSGSVTIPIETTSASLGVNGWHYDSNTGILTQWGQQPTTGNGTFPVTFPRAFVDVYNVSITRIGSTQSPTGAVTDVTNTGFTLRQNDGGNGGSYWQAIGTI